MRPHKEGLDYFSFDVDFFDNDKVKIIRAKHGDVGELVLIRLLAKIYRTKGYYYPWGEKEQLVFAGEVGRPVEQIQAIVSDALKWGFFSENLGFRYGILTSAGIQERFIQACAKRSPGVLVGNYLLIDPPKGWKVSFLPDNPTSDVVSGEKTGVSGVDSTQSKGKERKGKKSKGKKGEIAAGAAPPGAPPNGSAPGVPPPEPPASLPEKPPDNEPLTSPQSESGQSETPAPGADPPPRKLEPPKHLATKKEPLRMRPYPDEPPDSGEGCWMTDTEWKSLINRMPSGLMEAAYWAQAIERWAVRNPQKYRKTRDHYLTALNWYERTTKDEKKIFLREGRAGAGYYPDPDADSEVREQKKRAFEHTKRQSPSTPEEFH